MKDMKDVQNRREKKVREQNKSHKRTLLLLGPWVVVILLAVTAASLYFWFQSHNVTYQPDGGVFLYSMGDKLVFDEDFTLKRTDGGTLLQGITTVASDGVPLVFTEEQKLLLPVSMGYVRPDNGGTVYRVNYFSTIEYREGVFRIDHNDVVSKVEDGFLYDGNGTYIFLDSMKITVGDATYEIAPMSYAKEYYRDSVEIYDVRNDNYRYVVLSGTDAVATSETGYSINLGTGVLTQEDSQRILFSDIEEIGALK
ncbi:MAG: hypothetical protein IJ567_05265 [Lachnospiraceae bacterium]|nr:hypothetical protein [Lachnospiraceae bacterium]